MKGLEEFFCECSWTQLHLAIIDATGVPLISKNQCSKARQQAPCMAEGQYSSKRRKQRSRAPIMPNVVTFIWPQPAENLMPESLILWLVACRLEISNHCLVHRFLLLGFLLFDFGLWICERWTLDFGNLNFWTLKYVFLWTLCFSRWTFECWNV